MTCQCYEPSCYINPLELSHSLKNLRTRLGVAMLRIDGCRAICKDPGVGIAELDVHPPPFGDPDGAHGW